MYYRQRIILILFSLIVGCSQDDKLDFDKIQWTRIDSMYSFYCQNASNIPLTSTDSLNIKIISDTDISDILKLTDSKAVHLTSNNIDTILFPQYPVLRRNLRKNSKAIVKVDLSFISKSAAEKSKTISVYLTEKMDSSNLQKFIREIQTKEFVESIKLISKEDAMNNLSKDLGEDFTKFLGSNPLMDALEIRLKPNYVTTKEINQIKANLKKDLRVNSVTDSGQIDFIDKYRDKSIFLEIRT